MAEVEEVVLICDGCKASIYREHLERRTAERIAGKIYCPACMSERRQGNPEPVMAAAAPAHAPSETRTASAPHQVKHHYRRAVDKNSPFGTRSRTFHCRLSEAGFSHLNAQIDEWVDSHDDIQIKFATSSIGVIDGKHSESHLIITVFY